MTEGIQERLIESALWKELVEKLDNTPGATRLQIAKNLTVGDVPDLIVVLESGSKIEQYAALAVLVEAAIGVIVFPAPPKREVLVPFEAKLTELAERLTQRLQIPDNFLTIEELREEIRQKKPELPLNDPKKPDTACRAYTLLTRLNRERALRFVLGHFDYASLSERKREYVIGLIGGCCGPITEERRQFSAATKRLIEIARNGEPGAQKAADALIYSQLMKRSEVQRLTASWREPPPYDVLMPGAVQAFIALSAGFKGREAELEGFVRQWMRTKSNTALSPLYSKFISQLPEGAPLAPILKILGTPTSQNDKMYVLASDEGPALMLERAAGNTLGGLGFK